MCGCSGGACVVALGGCAWLLWGQTCVVAPGGHAWLLLGGGACMVAHWGACVVALWGHAWLLSWGHAWDTTRYGDTINERAVCILLECILVFEYHDQSGSNEKSK